MARTLPRAGVSQRHPRGMRHRRSVSADDLGHVQLVRPHPVAPVVRFASEWTDRFFAVQGIDRAMAIAAQAYSAFLPLLIVYASILPRGDNQDFADVLCQRFELRGASAASVQQAFAPAG